MPVKLIAENLTVADPVLLEAIQARNPGPLREIAGIAAAVGAEALDINLGPARKGLAEAMEFVLDALTDHWGGRLWLDGTDPKVMELAASRWRGGTVLNGYALDASREAVLDLAVEYKLDLVVFLMGRHGIPKSAAERLALAAELAGRAEERGLPLQNLVFDPVLAPLGWTDGQEINSALREILPGLRDLFGGEARSVLGLGNLVTRSTGGEKPRGIEELFLTYAAGLGLTHAMVNVKNADLLKAYRAVRIFEGLSPFAPGEFQ